MMTANLWLVSSYSSFIPFQSFNNLEYCRTGETVFKSQRQHLVKTASVGVRVFAAGTGTVIINGTIVFQIKERAGHGFENKITILILYQVISQQLDGFNAQVG